MALVVVVGTASCTPEERNFGNTGGGGTGAGGSAGVCTPDEAESCYTGPPTSLEVGVCKSGTHVCLPSGEGFGECGGEVVPSPENCLTPEDEACNGDDPTECPSLADGWLKAFGSLNFGQSVQDIAVTSDGDIVVVGGFNDTVDFGTGPVASTGLSDIFVAKFDPLGNAKWVKRFGDAAAQVAFAVAVDNTGAVYVGGSMTGSVDFEGTFLTSAGSEDAFLARFEADGKFVWAHNFGDAAKQTIRHLEVSKTNMIVAAGEFAGVIAFDASGMNVHTAAGTSDIFVARFDTSGFVAGSRRFGGPAIDLVRGLALDSLDRVYITGSFEGTANFNGPMLFSTGGRDAYVAALSPTLDTFNALAFGNPNGPMTHQDGYDVVVMPNDEVVVSGSFAEAIDIAGDFIANPEPLSRSLFITRFAPELSTFLKAQPFGGVGGSVLEGRLAVDPVTKELVIAGSFTGDMDFGGLLLQAKDAPDPYFAKLTFDGAFVAARSLPNEPTAADNANNINSLALLASGDLIVGGVQRTPITYGGGVVGEADSKDGNALLGRFIH